MQRARHVLAACPLAFGEGSVKQRIKAVLHYKKPAFWVLAISAAALVLLTVGFMTSPPEARITGIAITENEAGDPHVRIDHSRLSAGHAYYSIHKLHGQDKLYAGGKLVENDGSLGQYRLVLSFHGIDISDSLTETYPPDSVHTLLGADGQRESAYKIRIAYPPDSSQLLIYIGADQPLRIAERSHIPLGLSWGRASKEMPLNELANTGLWQIAQRTENLTLAAGDKVIWVESFHEAALTRFLHTSISAAPDSEAAPQPPNSAYALLLGGHGEPRPEVIADAPGTILYFDHGFSRIWVCTDGQYTPAYIIRDPESFRSAFYDLLSAVYPTYAVSPAAPAVACKKHLPEYHQIPAALVDYAVHNRGGQATVEAYFKTHQGEDCTIVQFVKDWNIDQPTVMDCLHIHNRIWGQPMRNGTASGVLLYGEYVETLFCNDPQQVERTFRNDPTVPRTTRAPGCILNTECRLHDPHYHTIPPALIDYVVEQGTSEQDMQAYLTFHSGEDSNVVQFVKDWHIDRKAFMQVMHITAVNWNQPFKDWDNTYLTYGRYVEAIYSDDPAVTAKAFQLRSYETGNNISTIPATAHGSIPFHIRAVQPFPAAGSSAAFEAQVISSKAQLDALQLDSRLNTQQYAPSYFRHQALVLCRIRTENASEKPVIHGLVPHRNTLTVPYSTASGTAATEWVLLVEIRRTDSLNIHKITGEPTHSRPHSGSN